MSSPACMRVCACECACTDDVIIWGQSKVCEQNPDPATLYTHERAELLLRVGEFLLRVKDLFLLRVEELCRAFPEA